MGSIFQGLRSRLTAESPFAGLRSRIAPLDPEEEARRKKREELERIAREGDIGPAKDPYEGVHPHAAFGEQIIARVKEGVASLPETLSSVTEMKIPGTEIAPFMTPQLERLRAKGHQNPLNPYPLTPDVVQDTRASVAEEREAASQKFAESQAAQGRSPMVSAALDTLLEGAAAFADPTNALPIGKGAQAARRASLASEAIPTPAARSIAPQEAFVREAEPAPLEAMQHAGSDVSPEALNRTAAGYRYYRITPGGETIPILADAGAVDVRVNPGEVKVLATPRGERIVEQGTPNPVQQRAMADLEATRPREIEGPDTHALDLEEPEGDLLAQLGVERVPQPTLPTLPDPEPARASREAGFIKIGEDTPQHAPEIADARQSFFDSGEPKRMGLAQIAKRMVEKGVDDFEDELAPFIRTGSLAGPEWQRTFELLADQARGAGATAKLPVTRFTRRWDPAKLEYDETGPPLTEITSRLDKKSYEEFEAYLAARSHFEDVRRSQEARTNPLSKGVSVDPKTTEKMRKVVDYVHRDPVKHGQFEQFAQAFYDWDNRAGVDALEGAGFLSKEVADKIRTERTNHVRYQRIDAELRAKGVDMAAGEEALLPSWLRTGRDRPFSNRKAPKTLRKMGITEDSKIAPVISAAAENAARISRLVDQQVARNALGDFIDAHPEIGEQVGIRQLTNEQMGGPSFVQFKDGKRIVWAAPTDVLEAVDRMSPKQTHVVLKAAGAITRFVERAAVLAPDFAPFNLQRDIQQGFVYSRHGFLPTDAIGMFFRELFGEAKAKKIIQEFEDSPAGHSLYMAINRDSLDAQIKEARTLARPGGKARQKLQRLLNPSHWPVAYNNALERVTRVAEMELAEVGGRKTVAGIPIPFTKGKGHLPMGKVDAAHAGGEVSLNFKKRGTLTKKLKPFFPFINPEFLDTVRFFREHFSPSTPRERRFAVNMRAVMGVTLPAIALAYKNKDNENYQNLSPVRKGLLHHWHEIEDGRLKGWWIATPRPLGLLNLVFGTIPQLIVEELLHKERETADLAIGQIVEQTPLHWVLDDVPGEGVVLDPGDLGYLGPIEPLMETRVNYNRFAKRPLRSETLDKLPDPEQFTERTSPIMRKIGQATGKSPIDLQHVFEGYTAGSGRFLLKGADAAYRQLSDEPDLQLRTAKDIPIAGRFFEYPPIGPGSMPVQEFFQITKRVLGEEDTIRRAERAMGDAQRQFEKEGPPAAPILNQAGKELERVRGQYGSAQETAGLLEGTREEIYALMDARQDVVRSTLYDRDEKFALLASLDQQMALLALRATAAYRLLTEKP